MSTLQVFLYLLLPIIILGIIYKKCGKHHNVKDEVAKVIYRESDKQFRPQKIQSDYTCPHCFKEYFLIYLSNVGLKKLATLEEAEEHNKKLFTERALQKKAYFANEIKRFRELGIEKCHFSSCDDNRTCKHCSTLNNKLFNIAFLENELTKSSGLFDKCQNYDDNCRCILISEIDI